MASDSRSSASSGISFVSKSIDRGRYFLHTRNDFFRTIFLADKSGFAGVEKGECKQKLSPIKRPEALIILNFDLYLNSILQSSKLAKVEQKVLQRT